jgi:type IV pilus assembly protein PilM
VVFRRKIILDCGASCTRVGVFRGVHGELELRECATERLPEVTTTTAEWITDTAAALQALRAQLRGKRGLVDAVIVLPPHLVLTKRIKIPRLAAEKREKVIRFEAEQAIPYAFDDIVWDSVTVSHSATEEDVLLAAAKAEVVEALCAAAHAAGFRPRWILPAILTTLAAFRWRTDDAEQPVLVLNIGARSTVLVLSESDLFAARSFSLGGNLVPTSEASELGETTAESAALLATLATRLAQEVTRSVMHFKREIGLSHPERVLLTGGAASIEGLDHALALKLTLPVARLDLKRGVEISADEATGNRGTDRPALADLVGAAAMELKRDWPRLNLLPTRRRAMEEWRRRRPWLIAAAALMLVALILPVWKLRAHAVETTVQIRAIEQELDPLRLRDARNRADRRELETVLAELEQLQRIEHYRMNWVNLLADLQQQLVWVEDVWLDEFRVVPADHADDALRLTLSGRMLDPINPLSKVSAETSQRVKVLLARLAASPFVARIERERFDANQPGVLKFDVVLVADARRPL